MCRCIASPPAVLLLEPIVLGVNIRILAESKVSAPLSGLIVYHQMFMPNFIFDGSHEQHHEWSTRIHMVKMLLEAFEQARNSFRLIWSKLDCISGFEFSQH